MIALRILVTLTLTSLVTFVSGQVTQKTPIESDIHALIRTGEEAYEVAYTLTETGCNVNGTDVVRYDTVTLELLDPCIVFLCTENMVIVMEESSGCYDGKVCTYGMFQIGCNTYTCIVNSRTHTRTQMVYISKDLNFYESERCEIYAEDGCFRLNEWHYFKGKRCFCESSLKVKCQNTGPAFMGPAVMNYGV